MSFDFCPNRIFLFFYLCTHSNEICKNGRPKNPIHFPSKSSVLSRWLCERLYRQVFLLLKFWSFFLLWNVRSEKIYWSWIYFTLGRRYKNSKNILRALKYFLHQVFQQNSLKLDIARTMYWVRLAISNFIVSRAGAHSAMDSVSASHPVAQGLILGSVSAFPKKDFLLLFSSDLAMS